MARTFAGPAGAFVLDDTTFLKAGTHSVDVQRQYRSALGKKVNRQRAHAVLLGARGYTLDQITHMLRSDRDVVSSGRSQRLVKPRRQVQ